MSNVLDKMLERRVMKVAATLATAESYLASVRANDDYSVLASCNVAQAARDLVKETHEMHQVVMRIDDERGRKRGLRQ
jgi:hypothetical protein